MNRFKKLSSIVFLLLAFSYPPALAEAKDTTLNHVLNEQSLDAQTKLVGQSEELLLAHRWNRRRYHRRQRTGRYYYQRQRNRRHYYRRRYRSINYHGQPYRHGEWELVRDRHGRLIYNWQR
ncbi:MAG: hypothetical protein RMZ41_013400 [Nostoc sp. DedVER02]|uniref:hypothetical protein n=1 Tax=unclassified Nostoc TaxID=2593658 RepID=UPI002AD2B0CF|nr:MULTISPECIES: hypothetical protein [unclassified Nostoc]MDZ7987691.1 hypothetical protein [Nostoc sp. DedVER02]MDZ8113138.1 hypothetical protein [Nostoc sp. DedVER01b]